MQVSIAPYPGSPGGTYPHFSCEVVPERFARLVSCLSKNPTTGEAMITNETKHGDYVFCTLSSSTFNFIQRSVFLSPSYGVSPSLLTAQSSALHSLSNLVISVYL